MEAIQEMCCKMGVQNEYEFHFNGAKGKYGMARRKKDNAEYGCKDIAAWEKKKKKKRKRTHPTEIYVICGSCWQCSGESVVATTAICRMQKG